MMIKTFSAESFKFLTLSLVIISVNPFVSCVPFLYPLKTSENLLGLHLHDNINWKLQTDVENDIEF